MRQLTRQARDIHGYAWPGKRAVCSSRRATLIFPFSVNSRGFPSCFAQGAATSCCRADDSTRALLPFCPELASRTPPLTLDLVQPLDRHRHARLADARLFKAVFTGRRSRRLSAPHDFQKMNAPASPSFIRRLGSPAGMSTTVPLRDITGWNKFIAATRASSCASTALRIWKHAKGNRQDRHRDRPAELAPFPHRWMTSTASTAWDSGSRSSPTTTMHRRRFHRSARPRLTEYGAQIVARMNAVGMAVDVSHCSDAPRWTRIHASQKPVLVTHSNCRALVPGAPAARPMKPSGCWRREAA